MHDWHTPGNWCGGVPDATKDAIIPPTPWDPIISSALPADCKNLNIYTGARLFINSDAASSGSLIVHGSQTGSGTVTYNRYTDASRYYLVSSPVSGADISPLMATSNGFAPYNEPSNSWGGYLTSGTLSDGVGYAMYRTSNSSDLPFTGSISGDVTVPVSSSYSRYGWNSLGNPYTSAINAKDNYGLIARNYAVFHPGYAAVYIWNAVANTYWVITQTGYYYENLWHDYYQFGMYTGVGHIQAGQGFLINVVWPATNPTIVFEKAMQEHASATTLKKAAPSWPGLTLFARKDNGVTGTIVTFNENGTLGLDKGLDVGLLSASTLQLYTHMLKDSINLNLCIQTLPPNLYHQLSIPVGIETSSGGKITFYSRGIVLPEGIYPVLEDKLLNIRTPLKTEKDEYSVLLPDKAGGAGRFYLSFDQVTGSEKKLLQEINYTATYFDRKIVIFGSQIQNASVTLYDANGRKLGNYRLRKDVKNEIPAFGLANGFYLLHIQGEKGNQVIKIPVISE